MSADALEVTMPVNQDLVKVEKALAGMDKVRAGLADLKERFGSVIFSVGTPDGMRSAIEARRTCREPRLEVERIRKDAKAPILALGRALDRTAAQITSEIEAIEIPIDRQIKAEEQRIADERQARITADLNRVEQLRKRLAYIQHAPVRAAGKTLAQIDAVQRDLSHAWAPGTYDEFEAMAAELFAEAGLALESLHEERAQFEADQAELARQRAENERLRAEQAERDRIEREERDRQEAAARLEERQAAERREAEETAARKLEQERLDQQRAELDARQREQDERDRKAREEVDRKERLSAARRAERQLRERKAQREEIIALVAQHFDITAAAAEQTLNRLFEVA